MEQFYSAWHIDADSALKRRVRIETIGKTFILYEHQWRSEAYFFGDLVFKAREGDADVFGLKDGLVARPKWRLGIKGDAPPALKTLLPPPPRKPMLSGVAILIAALLCVAIVYLVSISG